MSADTQSPIYHASCPCGRITISVNLTPDFFYWCHCYRCRVDTASTGLYACSFTQHAFTHNVNDSMVTSGKVTKVQFGASVNCYYYRCTQCDTRVFHVWTPKMQYTTYPSLFDFARVGDDETVVRQLPDGWAPTSHIFYSMRMGGTEVNDGLNCYAEHTDSQTIDYKTATTQLQLPESTDNTVHRAQCKCGNIQWSVRDNPLSSQYCHCWRCRVSDTCEHRLGHSIRPAQFSTNIDSVDTATYIERPNAPACPQVRYIRCTKCDTRCYQYNSRTQLYGVYASLFEFGRGDSNNVGGALPAGWRPDAHIWYNCRLGGHDVDDGLKHYVLGRDGAACDYRGHVV